MGVHTIYTDASFCAKAKVAGYAYRMHTSLTPSAVLGGGCLGQPVSSNNTAELTAICRAVTELAHNNYFTKGDRLTIITDSFFCIDRLANKKALKSTPEQKHLIEWYNQTIARFELEVTFKHVKAHAGRKGGHTSLANNWCDIEARRYLYIARAAAKGTEYEANVSL